MENLRNIAIIAHVDHGKTTLVDAILKQTEVFRMNQVVQECVMDSNDIERERGITILSKNTSVVYEGIKINIIDTPGHADFGGEVERVLSMADGVLLLVDAFEGPMPQTRYVLQKALSFGLKPLVVINKIDRPDARPDTVLDEIFDLFVDLEADDSQLDFQVIYASGRDGYARKEPEGSEVDCRALLDAVLEYIPCPDVEINAPLQFQVVSIDYNDYVGRIAIGRIVRGKMEEKQSVLLLKPDGSQMEAKVEELHTISALTRNKVKSSDAGEIVCITGIPEVDIGDTICAKELPEALPHIKVDEPTLRMEFLVNDSPYAGKEGNYVTSRHLRSRLMRELQSNVALKVLPHEDRQDTFVVCGRGLLHLGILIENMRREGYEFAVGKPSVILKEIDGVMCEPVEVLTVDVPDEFSGKVMEIAGLRKANLEKMEKRGERHHISFKIPSRGLIGIRNRMLNATKGEAVIYHVFSEYQPFKGEIPGRQPGVMVSIDTGEATSYAIDALQIRGEFFIKPQTKVYPGMIVGENSRSEDLLVNICKGKKLTNTRAAGSDRNLLISPPRDMSLETALEYIEEDELVEITPLCYRLRKRILDENERKRIQRNSVAV
ncbi:MAG: translational GTPase TypA [Planctomycetota bacterium]